MASISAVLIVRDEATILTECLAALDWVTGRDLGCNVSVRSNMPVVTGFL